MRKIQPDKRKHPVYTTRIVIGYPFASIIVLPNNNNNINKNDNNDDD